MRDIDQQAIKAASDNEELALFIKSKEFFILKVAVSTAKRYITKSDDEYSIALLAFYDAVKKYNYDRGSFLAFAKLLISQSLIDHFRQMKKYDVEVEVDWLNDRPAVDHHDHDLQAEIMILTDELKKYGFTFMDLVDNSPKAIKTKNACGIAVRYLIKHQELIDQMRISKQLPIKIIEKNTDLPRKILEHYRKYLIAVAEILSGDYPYLSEYLSYIKKEVIR